MILMTERLCLRPWREDDAAELFHWASDPEIGPAAGWTPHRDEADSRNVLRTVLINDNTWALTLRGSDAPIGSIGVFPTRYSAGGGEPEIGYWIARPYWGHGLVPEAVQVLIAHSFKQGAGAVWCGHFPENGKSCRVIEKCGFRYRGEESFTGSDGITHPCLYYAITREDWER